MTGTAAALPPRRALRDLSPTRLRAVSGMVLFAFVLAHFLNHALGLVSLEAMEAARSLRIAVTRSLPGTALLLAAATVHLVLGFARLLALRDWRIGPRSLAQIGFGLVIPFLLMRHVLGTRGVHELFGVRDDYSYALWAMWPGEAWNQAILMVLVWGHGCIGLHNALATRPWYRRARGALAGLALLVPVLAYAGFVSAGRLARVEGGFANPFSAADYTRITGVMSDAKWLYYGALAALVLVWAGYMAASWLRPKLSISYANGPTVKALRGQTLLAISQANRIPHASVCGGRARCSTCRVRVLDGQENLPPASDRELLVLRRVGAPANVRLACQIVPSGPITVSTLLPAKAGTVSDAPQDKYFWGVEQEVTILFCDLRGFTKMSEGRLPYDVVFLLNQFLGRMAEAIEDSGGFVDKFMGDGIMAIFGIDRAPDVGARQAVQAARAMGGVLEALNQTLREELRLPLSMGIGLHTGPAILGRIGATGRGAADGGTARLTALGETVNLASRLESKTKDLEAQVALSAACAMRAGLPEGPLLQPLQVDLRGFSQPVPIFALRRATDLPEIPGTQG